MNLGGGGCGKSKKKSSGSGNSQFDKLKGKPGKKKGTGDDSDLSNLEDEILGPSYDYVAHIKTPAEMGMSSRGTFKALADDVGGLLGYIDALVSGGGALGVGTKTKTGKNTWRDYPFPLGNKFFLDTAVKCKDEDGEEHTRSLYINNVPDGSIPFLSSVDSNIQLKGFQGLLPGVMSNLAQIKPLAILGAFTAGPGPRCQLLTMETLDENHVSKLDSKYVTNDDIAIMPADWFPASHPQDSYDLDTDADTDGFCTIDGPNSQKKKEDYSKMPDDIVIKIYYNILGLLGIYILLRMMIKKK
jgi:hypothetical protein